MDNEGASSEQREAGRPAMHSAASWNPALRDEKDFPTAARTQIPAESTAQSSSEEEDEESEEEEEEAEEGEVDDDGDDNEDDDEEEDEDSAEKNQDSEMARNGTGVVPSSGVPHSTNTVAQRAIPPSEHEVCNMPTSLESRPADVDPVSSDEEEESSEESSNGEEEEEEEEEDDDEEEEEEEEEEEDEDEPAEAERPAENYEHQSETTALEEAVVESVKVPLVADTEADDWGSSGEPFDLPSQPQSAPLETPIAEAVGTTFGDSVIGNTHIGGNAGEDIDWGNTEEQEDFFGPGASQTLEVAQDLDLTPGAHVVPSDPAPTAGNEWDLDLDLDDDFLPDKEDAPVFELSDDDGFLEDDSSTQPPQPVPQVESRPSTASRYAPQLMASPAQPTNQFAPQTARSTSLLQGQQTSSLAPAYNGFGQNSAYQQQPARPAMAPSAQSFVDKSKGGYASPYDLPDDIITTRRRPAPRTTMSATQPSAPPPRTSSMSSNAGPPRPMAISNVSDTGLPSPSIARPMQTPNPGQPPFAPAHATPPVKSPASDFFADLPITSKPRPSGRYTPQPSATGHHPVQQAPPHMPPKERTPSWSSGKNQVVPNAGPPPPLRQPEQLPMFPSQPSVPARTNSLPVPQPAPPAPSNRYSPSPQSSSTTRFSPAPTPLVTRMYLQHKFFYNSCLVSEYFFYAKITSHRPPHMFTLQ